MKRIIEAEERRLPDGRPPLQLLLTSQDKPKASHILFEQGGRVAPWMRMQHLLKFMVT